MPFKLRGINLDRVDLVPAGSNPEASIMLFKSEEEADVPVASRKKAVKKGGRPDTRKKKTVRGEDDEDDEEEDDAVNKADDDEEEEDEEEETDDEESDEEEEEDEKPSRRKKAAKKPAKKKTKKAAKADEDDDEEEEEEEDDEDNIEKSDDDDDDDLDDEDDEEEEVEEVPEKVLKSLPASVRKSIERNAQIAKAAAARAKKAMDLAKAEQVKRETTEYIQKAKKLFPNLTGTEVEKGAMLQALYSGAPLAKEVRKFLIKVLKSGDAAIRSLLMTETGRRNARVDSDSPEAQLRQAAEELRKKDAKLTKEQAFEKACDLNPDLMLELDNERARSRRRVVDID